MPHKEHPNGDAQSARSTKLLSRSEIESEFGLRANFLEKLAVAGRGPTYLKLGRRLVRYRRADVEQWLAEHRVCSTSEYRTDYTEAR
jgi:predicted DNA-binding transcriptional regulator AlpA